MASLSPRLPMSPPHTPAELAVPVVEEQLEVERARVHTGSVHVHKQVEEVPAHIQEPVTAEVVDVQRVPVGRVVEQPPQVRHEGDVLVVPVVQERLVLRKELVLVEEVRITRRLEHRMAEQQTTLRRERVDIVRHAPGDPPPQPNPQEP